MINEYLTRQKNAFIKIWLITFVIKDEEKAKNILENNIDSLLLQAKYDGKMEMFKKIVTACENTPKENFAKILMGELRKITNELEEELKTFHEGIVKDSQS